jgi:hypothetical protein
MCDVLYGEGCGCAEDSHQWYILEHSREFYHLEHRFLNIICIQ